MIKQYVPSEKHFTSHNAPNISIDDIVFVKNATICIDAFNTTGTAIYDNNENLCPESLTYRFDNKTYIPKFRKTSNFINENVVFAGGGYIFSHFGHFLLEGLARLYPVLDKAYRDKKFVFVVNRKTKCLPKYVITILSALGIKTENIILINKTTQFAGIYIPPQASIITQYISPIMNRVFDKIAESLDNVKIKTYDKIYLSRGRMNDGRTFGEAGLESIFAKNGYKIIYPETLPLCEQIILAHNCHVLAGTAGTALHLALFMQHGGRVIQIKRNSLPDDNAEIQNDICNLRGLDFTYVAGSIEQIPSHHFTFMPQILGITPEMIKFFNDNNFQYSTDDIAFDNKIWNDYQKYLTRYNRHQKYKKIIKPIARFISIFGITKYRRQIIREYITHIMHAD